MPPPNSPSAVDTANNEEPIVQTAELVGMLT